MKVLDRQIRYFLTIAKLKSLTRAAEALGLSQSSLSKQLRQLEDHLGHPLFRRHGRGVNLTDTGRKLYDVATLAFTTLDQEVAQLQSSQGVTAGTVQVATVHTLTCYLIPKLVGSFLRQYPDANVSIMGRSSPGVVELVESGQADIGFVYDVAVASGSLNVLHLFEEEMRLVFHHEDAAKYRSTNLAGSSLPLIAFPPHYALRQMLRSARLDRNVIAEVDTVDAMLKLVASRLGCCILPDRVPEDLIEGRHLLRAPIERPPLRRKVVAITRNDKPLSPLLRVLLDLASSGKR